MVSTTRRIVKNVVPTPGITKLKQANNLLNRLVLRLLSISPWVSSLYYAFFSSAFRREHHSVLFGKYKYSQLVESADNSSYLLRRNIHRLEKGLLMKPRRDVFAVNYIDATVNCYKKVLSNENEGVENEEFQWFHDVLQEYFSVVGSEPKIDRLKQEFLTLKHFCKKQQCVPYKRNLDRPAPVDYQQFWELSQRRRSVRWYLPQPVPRELLDKAISAAVLSPSACNRQPFEFRIFDRPELVEQVSSMPMGTKGFNHNFPVVIAVVGKLRAYFSERDRHVIYIDASLASMSFMYALETLRLSSCPINWPDVESRERKMSSLLNLEADERVIMLISVGYPDPEGKVAYSQKKSLNQVRRYN